MKSPTLKSHDVLLLIDDAREAEMCRDIDRLRSIVSPVWENIEETPDYSTFSAPIRGELLRLSGVLLSHYGKSKRLTEYQSRAKDLLTCAVELFVKEDDRIKIAETSIGLAVAYWFAGEVNECDTILSSLEQDFAKDDNYSILLSIKINRIGCLNWHGDLIGAREVIESIQPWVAVCPDLKLLAQFYNQAGIIYRRLNLYSQSIVHLQRGIEICTTSRNHRIRGLSLNCLALTYREAGNHSSAHKSAEEAIAVFESIGDTGWIPHVLDTRALIFLDQGHIEEALETINTAIASFSEGEDYSGLTEAMFTKCRCLLRLKRVPDAFAVFSELGHLASVRIGEAALRKYCTMLAEEVRYIEGKTYRERTDSLKKQLIREALRASGGNIGRAADSLGESHQNLSFILKNKFPEIPLELGIKRKRRTANAPVPRKKYVQYEPPVQHVMMPKTMKFAYDFHVEEKTVISTFLISADLTIKLGLMGRKLVAVAKIGELKTDVPILYETRDGKSHGIGRLLYDEFTKLYVIHVEENDEFVFPADVAVIGVPIGYCDVESVNRDMLRFKKISFN